VTNVVDSKKNLSFKMIMNKSVAYLELHTCISLYSNGQIFFLYFFFRNNRGTVIARSCR